MALWPAAYADPLLSGGAWGGGPDPLSLGFLPVGGGFAGGFAPPGLAPGLGPGGQPFLDPYWLPGATAGSRRRIDVPPPPGAGRAGGEAREGEEGERRRRTHEPYIPGPAGWSRSIPCDFVERKKEYIVTADIPGVKKSELHVEALQGGTVLRFGHNPGAEREKEDAEEEGIFHRAERVTTFRNRNLRLPDDADALAIQQASYEDGVLTVVIPKKEPGRQARELQIE